MQLVESYLLVNEHMQAGSRFAVQSSLYVETSQTENRTARKHLLMQAEQIQLCSSAALHQLGCMNVHRQEASSVAIPWQPQEQQTLLFQYRHRRTHVSDAG